MSECEEGRFGDRMHLKLFFKEPEMEKILGRQKTLWEKLIGHTQSPFALDSRGVKIGHSLAGPPLPWSGDNGDSSRCSGGTLAAAPNVFPCSWKSRQKLLAGWRKKLTGGGGRRETSTHPYVGRYWGVFS